MLPGCRGQDATGEEVIKPYTPTTLDSDIGYFELVIKVTAIEHVLFILPLYCFVSVSFLVLML
jgi:hypothetical protein